MADVFLGAFSGSSQGVHGAWGDIYSHYRALGAGQKPNGDATAKFEYWLFRAGFKTLLSARHKHVQPHPDRLGVQSRAPG